MGDKSGISWCDATWNPCTGCTKVSPGCAHCYAETVANRFWATQYLGVEVTFEGEPCDVNRPRCFTDVQCHPDRLDQPLRWQRPRRIFVNSMSDLFHEDVPDAFIDQVFAVMALAHRHTFQVLTKRAERMRDYTSELGKSSARLEAAARTLGYSLRWEGVSLCPWPLPNVWLGVSVENQTAADERVPALISTPCAVAFLSCEPLLAPIHLSNWMPMDDGIDWVIVGGESGPKARPCKIDWIQSILAACDKAGVPCFVKQLGARAQAGVSSVDGGNPEPIFLNLKDPKGGNPSEWDAALRVQEYP